MCGFPKPPKPPDAPPPPPPQRVNPRFSADDLSGLAADRDNPNRRIGFRSQQLIRSRGELATMQADMGLVKRQLKGQSGSPRAFASGLGIQQRFGQ